MKIEDYWPDWREDIGDTLRASEGGLHPDDPPSMERIVQNQKVLLKAAYWLLAASQGATP